MVNYPPWFTIWRLWKRFWGMRQQLGSALGEDRTPRKRESFVPWGTRSLFRAPFDHVYSSPQQGHFQDFPKPGDEVFLVAGLLDNIICYVITSASELKTLGSTSSRATLTPFWK